MLESKVGEWVKEELQNSNMDTILIISGLVGLGYATHVAYRAVLEVISPELKAQVDQIPIDVTVPWVDTSKNVIKLGDGHTVNLVATFKSPEILLIDNMLSEEECDQMVEIAKSMNSVHSDEIDASLKRPSKYRQSKNYVPDQEIPLIKTINNRLQLLLNFDGYSETLNITRYDTGDFYRPHTDLLLPNVEHNDNYIGFNEVGQRTVSVIIYLNEVESGGETEFTHLGLKVNPRKGSAVFFYNVDKRMLINDSTTHCGCEVKNGTKYIALKMFRQGVPEKDM